MSETEKRKEEQLFLSLKKEARFKTTTWLEKVHFIHHALPERNIEEVDTSVKIFGRKFSMPFYISAMTGGFLKGKEINFEIAEAARDFGVPLFLGSQRAMLEDEHLKETYYVKREYPDLFVVGNIGATQLKQYSIEKVGEMVDGIEADALAIHLNPVQEIIQPEGDKDWKGVRAKIREIVRKLKKPVIVKEVGCGISREVARQLSKIGVKYIDIAGAGGTSWAKIEYMRGGSPRGLEEWGIPTALSILFAKRYATVLASGGITNGIEGMKAVALGAKMFGMASEVLKAVMEKKLRELMEEVRQQIRAVLFLTGCEDFDDLEDAIYLNYELHWFIEKFIEK